MGKMKNIFRHSAIIDGIKEISPAKEFMPEWYKRGDNIKDGQKIIKSLPIEPGFKLCSSFSDSLLSGYMMPLSMDIAIQQTDAGPIITWNNINLVSPIVEKRLISQNPTLPTPMGCSPDHFAWKTQHAINIPKGYSALIGHPLNRFDLPFFTLTGIVDGEFDMYNGSIPVYFSSTFEGIIPAGTPIAQIILFKRENWKSKIDKGILQKANLNHIKSILPAYGWYKKNIWKKKSYE
jgi:hypothetical protein